MTELNSFLDDILIIIVCYKQSLADGESFKSIANAIGPSASVTLFIYDNSSLPCAIPELNSAEIIYYHDPTNPGVSKAYNEGFKVATHLNKKWLLLADQDTTFPFSIFSDYWHAIQNNPLNTVFVPSMFDSAGPLSPFRLIGGRGWRVKKPEGSVQSFRTLKTINSGMLISVKTFKEVNGYDERFPMDYSDIVFCDRLAIKDTNFVLIPALCNHHFSATGDSQDLPTEIDRFQSFCKAVQLFKEISSQYVSVSWTILPRALKLSVARKTFDFLKIGFKHTVRNS